MSKTNTLLIRTPEGVVFSQLLAGPVTRFSAWMIDVLCIMAVVGTVCVYVLRTKAPEAAVIGALTSVLGALVLKGIVAIIRKDAGVES